MPFWVKRSLRDWFIIVWCGTVWRLLQGKSTCDDAKYCHIICDFPLLPMFYGYDVTWESIKLPTGKREFLNLHFEPLWWFTHSSFPDILKWVECEKKRCIIMTSNRENEESQPKRAISFMVQGIHILQSRKLWTLRSSGETWKRRMCANILRSKWFFLLPIFSINAPKRIYGFLRIILLTGVWVEFIITSNLNFFFTSKKKEWGNNNF